jgi:hypothetical protein
MVSSHTDARPWRDRAKLIGCRNRVYAAQRPGAENGVVGRAAEIPGRIVRNSEVIQKRVLGN